MIIPTSQDYIRHEIVCAKALTAFKVLHISFAAVRKKIPIYFSNVMPWNWVTEAAMYNSSLCTVLEDRVCDSSITAFMWVKPIFAIFHNVIMLLLCL